MIRWQTWQLLTPHFKKANAPRTPQAFCRFPWERSTEEEAVEMCKRSQVSEQEAAVLDKLFAKMHEQNEKKNSQK